MELKLTKQQLDDLDMLQKISASGQAPSIAVDTEDTIYVLLKERGADWLIADCEERISLIKDTIAAAPVWDKAKWKQFAKLALRLYTSLITTLGSKPKKQAAVAAAPKRQHPWIKMYKGLGAKGYSTNEIALLSYLYDKHRMYMGRRFYNTGPQCHQDTGMSYQVYRRTLLKLQERGLISLSKKGRGSHSNYGKTWIKFNKPAFLLLLDQEANNDSE